MEDEFDPNHLYFDPDINAVATRLTELKRTIDYWYDVKNDDIESDIVERIVNNLTEEVRHLTRLIKTLCEEQKNA